MRKLTKLDQVAMKQEGRSFTARYGRAVLRAGCIEAIMNVDKKTYVALCMSNIPSELSLCINHVILLFFENDDMVYS